MIKVLKPTRSKKYTYISPLKAGFSVLENMGYGVRFITMFDSLTDEERFNIVYNHNGFLMDDSSSLKKIILDIA